MTNKKVRRKGKEKREDSGVEEDSSKGDMTTPVVHSQISFSLKVSSTAKQKKKGRTKAKRRRRIEEDQTPGGSIGTS